MKRTFNITTYSEDLDRYRDREDLLSTLDGFDGLELMHCGEDTRGVVPSERIIGVHLIFFPYWYDFYTGDWRRYAGRPDNGLPPGYRTSRSGGGRICGLSRLRLRR